MIPMFHSEALKRLRDITQLFHITLLPFKDTEHVR